MNQNHPELLNHFLFFISLMEIVSIWNQLLFIQQIKTFLLIFYSMNNRINHQKFLRRSSQVYSAVPATNAQSDDLLNTSNLSLSSIYNSNEYNQFSDFERRSTRDSLGSLNIEKYIYQDKINGKISKNDNCKYQRIKLSYLPLQSMNSFAVSSPSNRIGAQRFSSMKSSFIAQGDSNLDLRYQLKKERQQNRKRVEKQKQLLSDKSRLEKELQLINTKHLATEKELRKIQQNLNQAESNLKVSYCSIQNLTKSLSNSELFKNKLESINKDLREKVYRLESELRISQEKNEAFSREVIKKQSEVKQMKHQLGRYLSKFRMKSPEKEGNQHRQKSKSSILQQNISPSNHNYNSPNHFKGSIKEIKIFHSGQKLSRYGEKQHKNTLVQTQAERMSEEQEKIEQMESIKQKDKCIKKLTKNLEQLKCRSSEVNDLEYKACQLQKLVGTLNEKIFQIQMIKLSNKYKFC